MVNNDSSPINQTHSSDHKRHHHMPNLGKGLRKIAARMSRAVRNFFDEGDLMPMKPGDVYYKMDLSDPVFGYKKCVYR